MPENLPPPTLNQKKRISVWAVLAFAGLLAVLVLMGVRLVGNDSTPVRMGEQPKAFTLTTFEGEVFHSADLRGKVVLVNFWASWCTTCDMETALLEQAWQTYQARNDDAVIFLGVAYMDTENASRAYLRNHGVTYPNGPDLRGEISRVFQVNSVPETFILDADGALRDFKIGPYLSLEQVLTAVDGVLSQSGE
jgi:cytochrome c biogenesis protein CcmG/thiol:disulfide interchange protein DsbE